MFSTVDFLWIGPFGPGRPREAKEGPGRPREARDGGRAWSRALSLHKMSRTAWGCKCQDESL